MLSAWEAQVRQWARTVPSGEWELREVATVRGAVASENEVVVRGERLSVAMTDDRQWPESPALRTMCDAHSSDVCSYTDS